MQWDGCKMFYVKFFKKIEIHKMTQNLIRCKKLRKKSFRIEKISGTTKLENSNIVNRSTPPPARPQHHHPKKTKKN